MSKSFLSLCTESLSDTHRMIKDMESAGVSRILSRLNCCSNGSVQYFDRGNFYGCMIIHKNFACCKLDIII